MMRPMKLAGSQLLFGEGCLAYLKEIPAKRAFIVTGGVSMEKNGVLPRVIGFLREAGAGIEVFRGVEPNPSFSTVRVGAEAMKSFRPDLIVALGGGSPMDAAKAMWVFYEHPELTALNDLLTASPFPALRGKARLCCIPSTAGSASEVSRSFVISDEAGVKHGLGNMEMMPDIALCDPWVTASMPPRITAETGMDAMTHALEALVSKRANYVSDTLVRRAIADIARYLPRAFADGTDMKARERMLNASMIAGMAFTNVSLGIVHSMAHVVGGRFQMSHGLANAVILPYIIEYNSTDPRAKALYDDVSEAFDRPVADMVRELNGQFALPAALGDMLNEEADYMARVPEMAQLALDDGCTKTNPVIPDKTGMETLFRRVYYGK